MDNKAFMDLLDKNEELKQDLFIRGFLLTNKKIEETDDFPFYGNWKVEKHGKFYFMSHRLTGMHIYTDKQNRIFSCLDMPIIHLPWNIERKTYYGL